MRDFTLQDVQEENAFSLRYKAVNNEGKQYILDKLLDSCFMITENKKEPDIVGLHLKHDHIVEIYDYFVDKVDRYLVMEYCDGGHLGDYMLTNKPDVTTRMRFMLDISQGICFLHTQGIIHRDIKPESIYLSLEAEKPICKVANFGLSLIKKCRHHLFASQVESFPYLAPEIQEGQSYNNSVDVFSLGMLFYALINNVTVEDKGGNKKIFPAKILSDTRYEYLNSIKRQENPNLEDFLKSYFREFEEFGRLVYFMVQTNSEDRPGIDFVLVKLTEAMCKYTTTTPVAEEHCDIAKDKAGERQLIKNEAEESISMNLKSVNSHLNNEISELKKHNKELLNNIREQEENHRKIMEEILDYNMKLKLEIEDMKKQTSNKAGNTKEGARYKAQARIPISVEVAPERSTRKQSYVSFFHSASSS